MESNQDLKRKSSEIEDTVQLFLDTQVLKSENQLFDQEFKITMIKEIQSSLPQNKMTEAFLICLVPFYLVHIENDAALKSIIEEDLKRQVERIDFDTFCDWAQDRKFSFIKQKMGKPFESLFKVLALITFIIF